MRANVNIHLPFDGRVVNVYHIDLFNCSSYSGVELTCHQPKYIRTEFIFLVEPVSPRPVGSCL